MDKQGIFLSKKLKIFDPTLCIFCQQSENLSNDKNDCILVRESANKINMNLKNKDIVYERLSTISEDELFYYHMTNSCYYQYISKINKLKQSKTISFCIKTGKNVQKNRVKRWEVKKRSINNNNDVLNCVICGSDRFKNIRCSTLFTSYRFKNLFEIAKDLQDNVFARIKVFINEKDCSSNNYGYHQNCLRGYEKRHKKPAENNECKNANSSIEECFENSNMNETAESLENSNINETAESFENSNMKSNEIEESLEISNMKKIEENLENSNLNEIEETFENSENNKTEKMFENSEMNEIRKKNVISSVINKVMYQIRSGLGFTLTEIRVKVEELLPTDIKVYNRDIKKYIQKQFKDEVEFSNSSDAKKSSLVYSSKIKES